MAWLLEQASRQGVQTVAVAAKKGAMQSSVAVPTGAGTWLGRQHQERSAEAMTMAALVAEAVPSGSVSATHTHSKAEHRTVALDHPVHRQATENLSSWLGGLSLDK